MHREKQSIILNILLFGLPGCGRNTFLQWIVQNENLLDANFLKAIENEKDAIRTHINQYMRNIKNMPGAIKAELNKFIDQDEFEECRRYFEIAKYRLQEIIKAYDEELQKIIQRSIFKLQNSRPSPVEDQTFSYIDIAGTAQITYRIHYCNYQIPTPIELSTFLPVIDGIIFVWDSQQDIEKNLESFELLLDNLTPNAHTPLIIALNKVDLPHQVNSTDLRQLLSQAKYEAKFQTTLFSDSIYRELTIFETVANQGVNLKSLINNIKRMIILKNSTAIVKLQNLIIQEVQQ
ncbi:MAG: ADP-ribosylation factor-like protein [Candidatus Helarchaeota archaeon]